MRAERTEARLAWSSGEKMTTHARHVTEPVYFLFLQNTNTSTFLSEGVAVHDGTVTAGVHFSFFFFSSETHCLQVATKASLCR